MNSKKVREVIKFDVQRNLQNKWFIILNIFMLICTLIATNIDNIKTYLEENNINFLNEEEVTIQLLDNENIATEDFIKEFEKYEEIKIEKVEENNYSKENVPEDNVILVDIEKDNEKIISVKLVSKESIDGKLYNEIYEVIKKVRSNVFADNNKINIEDLELLNEDVEIERQYLGIDAENAETKEMIKLASIVVLYMVLIFTLSRIANEIAQEKVSKSIEYVLTSVSAKEYLLAKVLSSTISVIIQIMYTIVYYFIGNLISNIITTNNVEMTTDVVSKIQTIDMSIVGYVAIMIVYLVFTVFLTTLIQAALSSKTTNVAEAGNTTLLLISIIMVLYIVSIGVISPYNKVSLFMYIFSCIPLVSTFFVPSMMIIGQATTLQTVVSFVLLIITIPLIFGKCARHFKNGILDYNTSKKRRGLFANSKKEMSIKEKQEYDLRVRNAKKVGFAIGISVILLIVLELICSIILQPILVESLQDNFEESTIFVIENSVILIIVLGITSLFIKYYDDYKVESKKISLGKKFEYILGGIAVIAGIQVLLTWLYPKIGLEHSIFDVINIIPNSTFLGITLYIIGIALVPAIFEELLFRKYILNCSKKLGTTFAVVFSALLFGIYHMNLNQAIFAFLMGIVFGVIAVQTGSIKLTVTLHFINNCYACLASIAKEGTLLFNVLDKAPIILIAIGIIVILKNIFKMKKINKEDLKMNPDVKFLFKDYTFIIAMALVILMLVTTEKMLIGM